jgi:hypothetical protein
MKNFIYAALIIIFCIANSRDAVSLDFFEHPNNKSSTLNAILALGDIVEGDADRLRSILRALPTKPNTAIYLGSSGGNLYEGIRLGVLFRQSRVKTVIEGGHDCASACAIAFLGGTDNSGAPWRSSSTNSRLGFHAFRGNTSDANHIQKIVSDILKYGAYVNAPTELLIVNFATPSDDIYWVPHRDICTLGIKLWSVTEDKFVCNG